MWKNNHPDGVMGDRNHPESPYIHPFLVHICQNVIVPQTATVFLRAQLTWVLFFSVVSAGFSAKRHFQRHIWGMLLTSLVLVFNCWKLGEALNQSQSDKAQMFMVFFSTMLLACTNYMKDCSLRKITKCWGIVGNRALKFCIPAVLSGN